MTIDPDTGILSGTPVTAGVNTFTVQVTDSQGTQSPAVSLSVNVSAPGGSFVQTTACPLPAITEGVLLDQVFTATGGAPPYTWSATGLPSGVMLNASGSLLGTPTSGIISFSIQATDAQQQQTAPAICAVQVNPAQPLARAPCPMQSPARPI